MESAKLAPSNTSFPSARCLTINNLQDLYVSVDGFSCFPHIFQSLRTLHHLWWFLFFTAVKQEKRSETLSTAMTTSLAAISGVYRRLFRAGFVNGGKKRTKRAEEKMDIGNAPITELRSKTLSDVIT